MDGSGVANFEANPARRGAWFVLSAVGVFATLMTAAMWLYPGGTFLNPHTRGHQQLYNFFCDLLRDPALNGQRNALGSQLALAAMVSFALALAPFWRVVTSLTPSRRGLAWIIRVAGTLASLGLIAVALMPSSRVGALHGVLTMGTSVPGMIATVGAVWALWSESNTTRWLGGLGAVMLLAATADAVFYTHHILGLSETSPALTILQKLAASLLIAWMVCVATVVLHRTRSA